MSHTKCQSNSSRFLNELSHALAWILSGIFAYAGSIKLANPWLFADSVSSFHAIPNSWINLVALILPCLEIVFALSLLWSPVRKEAALSLLALCGLFLILMLQALARGISFDCGCFGSHSGSSAAIWWPITRDVLLGLAAGYVVWYQRPIVTQENELAPAL